MQAWRRKMQRPPSVTGRLTKRLQDRINELIPEKVHDFITAAFKQMTRAVLTGAEFISPRPASPAGFQEREQKVREKISIYKNTAAAEGAITGAGGFLLGLADFPLWLSLKMKLLFDVAGQYGYDTSSFKERLFILYIFQLSFSSRQHRRSLFGQMISWDARDTGLPRDVHEVDWRRFQQEYRDYIDIAKLLQLIPGIGAAVGAIVNHRLTDKLGHTAMNAYRMRYFMSHKSA